MINNYYRELCGLEGIYVNLENLDKEKTSYRDIIPSIMVCHNSKVQVGTKMKPNDLRMINNNTNLLDINLKLAGVKQIN